MGRAILDIIFEGGDPFAHEEYDRDWWREVHLGDTYCYLDDRECMAGRLTEEGHRQLDKIYSRSLMDEVRSLPLNSDEYKGILAAAERRRINP